MRRDAQPAPTAEQREWVKRMAAAGEPHTDIAIGLNCGMAHLRENFADELLNGAVHCRQSLISKLWALADKGSVAAVRDLIGFADRASMVQRPQPQPATQGAAGADGPPAPTAKVLKLGKKEALNEAARNPDATTAMGALMTRRAGDAE